MKDHGECEGCTRRSFLAGLAGSGAAGGFLAGRPLDAALGAASGAGAPAGAEAAAAVAAAGRNGAAPIVRAVFLRPRGKYWLGWPGTSWDVEGSRRRFTELIEGFGRGLGMKIETAPAPFLDDEAVNAFVAEVRKQKPAGVVVVPLHMNRWPQVARIARCGVPVVVFAPLGTAFTGHVQLVKKLPGVYLASSGDFSLEGVRFGLKMIRTAFDIARTKIAVLAGSEARETTLKGLGMTLRYLPRQRFADEFFAMAETEEMKKIAAETVRGAVKVVEPKERDLLNGVKNYFTALKIMKDEGCQGITMDCLGLVAAGKIPCPPCLAWAHLLSRGVTAACEADINAVMSHTLCCHLLDRPGFQQDPVPDTVNNTLIGAHCVCAPRLRGYDEPPVPYILRSHSESNIGVSYEVKFPIGQEITVMQFSGSQKMLLGRGKVTANHETPPAGGCRTSVELALEWPKDTADTKGFHQLFIFGDHLRKFEAYGQMFGIAVEHI